MICELEITKTKIDDDKRIRILNRNTYEYQIVNTKQLMHLNEEIRFYIHILLYSIFKCTKVIVMSKL